MVGDREVAVRPDVLAVHAGAVDRVGETVQLGIDAARRVRLGAGAYGQLCQALPRMLDPLHDLADRVLTEARSALEESACSLRTAGEGYSDADLDAARRFRPAASGPP